MAKSARSTEPEPEPTIRRVRGNIVHTSVYLPRDVHRELRDIAHHLDCKIHDLIMEGIDAALKKHGRAGVAALKGATREA